jgi:hypothetical protein
MLKQQLQEKADQWAMLGAPAVVERFVARNGQEFVGRAKPKGYRLGTIKQCYSNATHLVLNRKGLRYVEGYVIRGDLPIPIHHAWAIDADDQVIDVTLRGADDRCHYCGVVIPIEEVKAEIAKNGVYSVMDTGWGLNVDWMFRRDPGLKAEIDAAAAMKIDFFRRTA